MNSRYSTSFLDVLFSLLLIFVLITTLLKTKTEQDASFKQNALYLVVLNWEGDADLDLWAQDPDGRQVGFNRREGGDGSLCSLNRDCLGAKRTEQDSQGQIVSKVNEEILSIRGIIPGEFIINVHSYNLNDCATPLNATVKLIKIKPFAELVIEKHDFVRTGEELTYFRFTITKDGTVNDINRLPISILGGGIGSEYEQPTAPDNNP